MPAHQTVQRGSTGPDVKAAQEELIARGYDCGATGADGIFGNFTFRAVIDYQTDRSHGGVLEYTMPLRVDGIVGIHTWTRLDPDTIKNGDRGPLVMLLQSILLSLGFNPGPIDGAFGPNTEGAVKLFQGVFSLPVTGVVDRDNWRAMNS